MKPGWCLAALVCFGAFPLAYAVIIDALSVPLTLMLIGLIFRGVAFEFRFKATPSHRPFWDKAFLGGSLLATFTQGMVVGAVIHGFPVSGRSFQRWNVGLADAVYPVLRFRTHALHMRCWALAGW